jgi:hypothetical protein
MEKKISVVGISRKEALQRLGKYAALTAVGTFLILEPMKAQSESPTTTPPNGGDDPFNP